MPLRGKRRQAAGIGNGFGASGGALRAKGLRAREVGAGWGSVGGQPPIWDMVWWSMSGVSQPPKLW